MNDTELNKLLAEAFTLGFMISREGFNGECAFEHCAGGLTPYAGLTEAEWLESMASNEVFQDLMQEALVRLNDASPH